MKHMKQLVLLGVLLFGVAHTASATPMYYTFRAEVIDADFRSYYDGPVRRGDTVYYNFLVDTDREAPARADAGYQNYFFAELVWIDYGHDLGLQYFNNDLSYGYNEPDSALGCRHSNGCGQILAPSPDRPGVAVYSTNSSLDPALGFTGISDLLLSDASIFNAIVTDLRVTQASVPEPSVLALFTLGIAGVGFLRYRTGSAHSRLN